MTPQEEFNTLPSRIHAIYDTCAPDEQSYLIQILNELSENGYSTSYENLWLEDYVEIPVDIDTFISDDRYLGLATDEGTSVYPFWKKCMEDIFDEPTQYSEIAFTGATRIGKTSTAVTCTAYMLYKLMCLRDPQKFYGKKSVSRFSILFFNVTKDMARGVAFKELQTTLRISPWFNEHGTFSRSDQNYIYIPDGGRIELNYGSDASHSLGVQLYCAVLDETNFHQAGVKDISKAKVRMKELYDTVVARVQGTFRMEGEVYGKVFCVSSKNSDSDFMEQHIQDQINAGNSHMYVVDKPQWEVMPATMFSSERFHIAVGDRYHKGFVVDDESDKSLSELQDQGYQLLEVPLDMKTNFLADFDIALRDIAGISVPGALSFITQDIIDQCTGDRHNPFLNDTLEIGTKDSYSIEEFFHIENIDPRFKNCPCFIHLDLSLNEDSTGLGGVFLSGRSDIKGDDGNITSLPTFSHFFSLALKPPRGDKIPYSKILNFIVWLRRQGFDIEGISRDQFQSEYISQLLEEQGFDVKKISVDRTPDPYQALRSILLEHRIDLLPVNLLQDELIHLQRDSITGKIDHPIGGCFISSTQIKLADGRDASIHSLLKEQSYKKNHVYTVNEDTKKIELKPIVKVFYTKRVSFLLEVSVRTLYGDDYIYCTPDHRFMMADGSYQEAFYLRSGDYLMSLYDGSIVTSVQRVYNECKVYDIEVQDNHNFALASGVFVHNSKDIADCIAGSVWNAVTSNPGVPVNRVSVAKAISNVNTHVSGRDSTMDNIFHGGIHKY